MFKTKKIFATMIFSIILFSINTKIVNAGVPYITSAKINGPNTVAITYSEPVNSNISDYSNFGGALSGKNAIYINGTGTQTITLTFDGGTLSSNSTGYISISTSTISTVDNSQFITGYANVSDGQSPAISSFSISSGNSDNTFGKIGNTLSLSFSANEPISAPYITINGHSITPSGNGNGPYTANYTLVNGDTEENIPVTITFSDIAGNTTNATFSVTENLKNSSTNSTLPSIISITSDATSYGVLKIGDTIKFTLVPNGILPGASVNGSYNGSSLYWTTSNQGATYTATYTVKNGDTAQNTPIQIMNVTITDQFGHTSQTFNGSDVQKTIEAGLSSILEVAKIPILTNKNNPSYTFYSNTNGKINYYGSCTGSIVNAYIGNNTIILDKLPNGFYNDCAISVTSNTGITSNILKIPGFTVDTTFDYKKSDATETSSTLSNAKHVFNIALKLGSKGEEVRFLQQKLKDEGFFTSTVNGNFGPATEKAVKAYQKAHKLSPLGNVGPGTRALLNK